MGMTDALLFAAPRLQPVWNLLQARAVQEVQAMEDADGDTIHEWSNEQ
jgi:hypothetical protein